MPKLNYSAAGATLAGSTIGLVLLLGYSASYRLPIVGLFLIGTTLATHLVWKWVSFAHSLIVGWMTRSPWFSPLFWHCLFSSVFAIAVSLGTILVAQISSRELIVSAQQRRSFIVTALLLSSLFPSVLVLLHFLRRQVCELDVVKKRAVKAEDRALRAQMNPHFLINSLNALLPFIRGDPGKAEEMVSYLAETFRQIIKSTRSELVTVEEELKLVESYLAIESVRFQDHLKVSMDIPRDLLRVLIPPLTLQPLIENSIKHGMRAGKGPDCGKITISAKQNGSHLSFSVSDNGTGFDFGTAAA